MTIKLVAFDLDGTLAPSKSAVPLEIAEMLCKLLEKYEVCVISGGKFEQFQKQLMNNMSDADIINLHLMPTCGTRYYVYYDGWNLCYSMDLSEEDANKAIEAIELAVKTLPLNIKNIWGPQIENRGSQITFSALGQEAPVAEKERWDLKGILKDNLRSFIQAALPWLEVRAGGSTSIDITQKGIDKAYGMQRLMKILNLKIDEIVFFGDRLKEGGNDYAVKEMGIRSIEVTDWKDTLNKVNKLLEELEGQEGA